jgi:hypothetical protein
LRSPLIAFRLKLCVPYVYGPEGEPAAPRDAVYGPEGEPAAPRDASKCVTVGKLPAAPQAVNHSQLLAALYSTTYACQITHHSVAGSQFRTDHVLCSQFKPPLAITFCEPQNLSASGANQRPFVIFGWLQGGQNLTGEKTPDPLAS